MEENNSDSIPFRVSVKIINKKILKKRKILCKQPYFLPIKNHSMWTKGKLNKPFITFNEALLLKNVLNFQPLLTFNQPSDNSFHSTKICSNDSENTQNLSLIMPNTVISSVNLVRKCRTPSSNNGNFWNKSPSRKNSASPNGLKIIRKRFIDKKQNFDKSNTRYNNK